MDVMRQFIAGRVLPSGDGLLSIGMLLTGILTFSLCAGFVS